MVEINKPIVKRIEPVIIEGRDRITGVLYQGQNATYEIYDKLTKPMTLQELSEYSMSEKEKGNPYVPNSQELWAIFTAIANSENSQLISRVQQNLRNNWIRTLSGIDWYSNGYARVIHNIGTPDSYSIQRGLIEENGWISKTNSKKLLENVLRINNVKEVNSVSQKINNTNMYQWRVNSKPNEKIRTGVDFDAVSVRLGLSCDGDPLDVNPAFRVLNVD